MRAVVTGGAGFIGSHLVDALVARGDEVHVLDNLATGVRERVNGGAAFREGDIRADAAALFAEARPEVVFHLAAQADVGTSVERPDYDADVNVVGTVRVLEAARACGAQVVFSSTGGAIYGECDGPAAEDAPRRPISPYGMAKLCGEEYLAGWNRLHGSGHVALRFANVYGPRQAASLEGGVVAIFLERLARGDGATIFGDGEQTRDFVFVGDVVAALLAAVGHDGGVFNVGTDVGERAPRGLPPRGRGGARTRARAGPRGRRAAQRDRPCARRAGPRLARRDVARRRSRADLGLDDGLLVLSGPVSEPGTCQAPRQGRTRRASSQSSGLADWGSTVLALSRCQALGQVPEGQEGAARGAQKTVAPWITPLPPPRPPRRGAARR